VRVLLVDDLEVNRLTLVALLEEDGHQVVEAGSCADARAQLRAATFEVVLLDLGLPDGNGASLIPDIRQQKGAKVVITSGSDVTGLAALVDGVITKGESYAAIQALLAGFA